MIVVFAHTGGLVGAEVGVAGGTAVLAQRVLGGGLRRPGRSPAGRDREGGSGRPGAGADVGRAAALPQGAGCAQVQPDQAEALRDAAAAVELAREGGLPVSETDKPGYRPVSSGWRSMHRR